MNRLLVIIVLSACANIISAQADIATSRNPKMLTPIDTCVLSIDYQYTYHNDTLDGEQKYELYRLQIGKKYTRYYSVYGERADSIYMFDYVPKTSKGGVNIYKELGIGKNGGIHQDDCLFNYPIKGMLTHSIVVISNREYIYEEIIPEMNWTATQETDEILGYKCRKALLNFRGRAYEVWFATDIPIQYGPWKFNGLPGAILLITENKGMFGWKATSIVSGGQKIYYHIDKICQTHTNRDDYLKVRQLLWKDPVSLYRYIGKEFHIYRDGKWEIAQSGDLSYPYIPQIELE